MKVPHFSTGDIGRCCIALLLLSPLTCHACAVPVFRYALENWEPDRLTVAILHDGPLSAAQAKVLEQLNDAADSENSANLATHPIDTRADHPPNSPEAYYAAKWKDTDLPQMLVFFNNNAPEPQLAWSGSFNPQNIDKLLDSPARREVVERLLDGQSAVWVLLKTGNKADDERAEKELLAELKKKPDEIDLPSLTDLASEEKFDEDLQVEMRVEFSLITIEPDDSDEAFFREMLLNTESDLKNFEGPIAIPIYGRGRTYFALVGPGITADNIADNCSFICGACSCEVKRDNPGQDLLLAANWNRVQPGNWVNDTPLPELTGIGGLESLVGVDDDGSDKPIVDSVSDSETLVSDSVTKAAEVQEISQADGSDETVGSQLLAAHHVESDGTDNAVQTQPTPQTVGSHVVGTRGNVAPVVLVWGAVLFGMGLMFTVWQRSRNAD